MAGCHSFAEQIKKRYGATQEVHILHNDQPLNDFKSLFMLIEGNLQCHFTKPFNHKKYSEPFALRVTTGL